MDRQSNLERVANQSQWDVVVIGGGASGLGTALDAVSRGYKTLLIEQNDFAHGTSSRSTKLIHGGVRYLPQGRFLFVHKALEERAILLQNAPHLVHQLPLILPSSNWFETCFYGMGIKLYDFLGGGQKFNRSSLLSQKEVVHRLPTLDPKSLRGGICFYDGQFDDARMAITLAQTIVDQGGTVLNYMKVEKLLKKDGKVIGLIANNLISNLQHEIFAKVVINATGGFVDFLRKMDEPNASPSVVLSQGSHIVLDRSFFPTDYSLIIPKSSDGRILFVIPWYHRVLVGTTDVELGTMTSEPRATAEEIDYLLKHTENIFSKRPAHSDILSVFTGVRALLKPKGWGNRSSTLTREHSIVTSDSKLVSLIGGKWTTYRHMGEEAMDIAAKVSGLPLRNSNTKHLKLYGWQNDANKSEWGYYGSNLTLVEKLGNENPELLKKFSPQLPCRGVDVLWSLRNEMAVNLEDVLSRRNRSLLLGAKECMSIAPQVAALMAKELVKDKVWENEQVASFLRVAQTYLPITNLETKN